MARKAHDLLADLDELGIEEQAPASKDKANNEEGKSTSGADAGDDPLADIEKQLTAKRTTNSRPGTPRASSTATNTTGKSEKRGAEYTPASTSVGSSQRNSSEDRVRSNVGQQQVRTSTDGGRSFHQGMTPEAAEQSSPQQSASPSAGGGGGWWGSMFNAATAAVKQAESLAKEIRGNEEAQKWAEQMRGNFQNLQNFGTDLRSRALPTFTTLISHIAPPISAHERLQIHTTHDIQNYPSLDPIIYSVFSRVMSQVEGGDLLVLQRGSESRSRSSAETGYRGGVLGGGGNGWQDGPWWREETAAGRALGVVPGVREGSRLARVSAETYAKEFFDARGGVEAAAQAATQTLSETNPVRSSDIFLAIQAASYTDDTEYFAADAHTAAPSAAETGVVEPAEPARELVVFAVYLHDPIHSITFQSLSQPFPLRWAHWLDARADDGGLPESIMEIIQSGGVDPREWVAEWMEEIISLAVGVVAQQYVAKRMGVGEGGLGRGKRRVEEDGVAGEAARAI